jgi:hypothetical protein
MNVTVTAGNNSITVSGTDPTNPTDTVQVVITNATTGKVVVNDIFQNVPANVLETQPFNVNAGTYDVSVYWNKLNSVSIFGGVTVPPGGTAPQKPKTFNSPSTDFPKPPTNPAAPVITH